jgi:hypothetical protein
MVMTFITYPAISFSHNVNIGLKQATPLSAVGLFLYSIHLYRKTE